jgi:hypothetical protein
MLYVSFSANDDSCRGHAFSSIYSVRSCRINKLGIGTLYGLSISCSTSLFLFSSIIAVHCLCTNNITIQSVVFDIPLVEAISSRAHWTTSFSQAEYQRLLLGIVPRNGRPSIINYTPWAAIASSHYRATTARRRPFGAWPSSIRSADVLVGNDRLQWLPASQAGSMDEQSLL